MGCWSFGSRRRWKPSGLSLLGHEVRRQRGAFAEEVRIHLLDEELLGLGRAQVEAVFVHEHLHVLYPHLPGFLRDILVNFLAERMALERDFFQAWHFLLKFYTEDLPPGLFDDHRAHRVTATASASHDTSILRHEAHFAQNKSQRAAIAGNREGLVG